MYYVMLCLRFGNETSVHVSAHKEKCIQERGMEEDILELFQSIGLSEIKAKETAKNGAVSATLKALIVQVGTVNIDTSFVPEKRKECLLVTWGGAYAERMS